MVSATAASNSSGCEISSIVHIALFCGTLAYHEACPSLPPGVRVLLPGQVQEGSQNHQESLQQWWVGGVVIAVASGNAHMLWVTVRVRVDPLVCSVSNSRGGEGESRAQNQGTGIQEVSCRTL